MTVSARQPSTQLLDFISELTLSDVPVRPRRRLGVMLADMAAVCAAGRPAPAARMALDYARKVHPAPDASSLLDDERVGAVGAAFANGVLANVLDFDDGHRLTKGHPGAVIVPAALAAAQLVDATAAELLAAVAIGYEVSIRAGVALHRRDPAYHASGAWGGVGAAAAAARLLHLTAEQTLAALGLAEYHAAIAPIMRSCAEPRMTKDACAWGAAVGVQSVLLAAQGFSSVSPEFLDADDLRDLGERWCVEELYVKAYPCCRWSQGAIAATLAACRDRRPAPEEIARIRIGVFAAADGLAKVVPTTTEEAQYNLCWPVACAVVHGRFAVPDVLGGFEDPTIRSVFGRIEVDVRSDLTAQFPQRRLTEVEIECKDGRRLRDGPREAPGEPDDPELPVLVAAKVADLMPAAVDARISAGDRIAGLDGDGLLELLRGADNLCAHA
ncbi:MAG: MmgE/PrpD family protein [Solirubrobacteraceae bacterium]